MNNVYYSNIVSNKTSDRFIKKYNLEKFNEEEIALYNSLQNLLDEKKDWDTNGLKNQYEDLYDKCIENIQNTRRVIIEKKKEFDKLTKGSGLGESFGERNAICIKMKFKNELIEYPNGTFGWAMYREERQLPNLPPNRFTPEALAEEARKLDERVKNTVNTSNNPKEVSLSFNEQVEKDMLAEKDRMKGKYVNARHEALHNYFIELKTCQILSKQEEISPVDIDSLMPGSERRIIHWDKIVNIQDELQRVLNEIHEIEQIKKPKKYEEEILSVPDKREDCFCGCGDKAICIFRTPLVKLNENKYIGNEVVKCCEKEARREVRKIKFTFDFQCKLCCEQIMNQKYAYILKGGEFVCDKCWKSSSEK